MKRLIIASLLGANMGLTVNTAHAQIPVTDIASITADAVYYASIVLNWVDQYNQMKTQYEQLKSTHKAITGIRNLSDVFDNPQLRQLLPDDLREAYRGFRNSGYEGLVRKGVDIHARNFVFDHCEKYLSPGLRKNCESQPAATAQAHGDSELALAVIMERTAQIEQLQGQINATTDTKAIADIQARIAVEQATIQNESSRLYVLKMLDDTQQRLDAERQHQINQRTLTNTKGFSAGLEIPTFGQ